MRPIALRGLISVLTPLLHALFSDLVSNFWTSQNIQLDFLLGFNVGKKKQQTNKKKHYNQQNYKTNIQKMLFVSDIYWLQHDQHWIWISIIPPFCFSITNTPSSIGALWWQPYSSSEWFLTKGMDLSYCFLLNPKFLLRLCQWNYIRINVCF